MVGRFTPSPPSNRLATNSIDAAPRILLYATVLFAPEPWRDIGMLAFTLLSGMVFCVGSKISIGRAIVYFSLPLLLLLIPANTLWTIAGVAALWCVDRMISRPEESTVAKSEA